MLPTPSSPCTDGPSADRYSTATCVRSTKSPYRPTEAPIGEHEEDESSTNVCEISEPATSVTEEPFEPLHGIGAPMSQGMCGFKWEVEDEDDVLSLASDRSLTEEDDEEFEAMMFVNNAIDRAGSAWADVCHMDEGTQGKEANALLELGDGTSLVHDAQGEAVTESANADVSRVEGIRMYARDVISKALQDGRAQQALCDMPRTSCKPSDPEDVRLNVCKAMLRQPSKIAADPNSSPDSDILAGPRDLPVEAARDGRAWQALRDLPPKPSGTSVQEDFDIDLLREKSRNALVSALLPEEFQGASTAIKSRLAQAEEEEEKDKNGDTAVGKEMEQKVEPETEDEKEEEEEEEEVEKEEEQENAQEICPISVGTSLSAIPPSGTMPEKDSSTIKPVAQALAPTTSKRLAMRRRVIGAVVRVPAATAEQTENATNVEHLLPADSSMEALSPRASQPLSPLSPTLTPTGSSRRLRRALAHHRYTKDVALVGPKVSQCPHHRVSIKVTNMPRSDSVPRMRNSTVSAMAMDILGVSPSSQHHHAFESTSLWNDTGNHVMSNGPPLGEGRITKATQDQVRRGFLPSLKDAKRHSYSTGSLLTPLPMESIWTAHAAKKATKWGNVGSAL